MSDRSQNSSKPGKRANGKLGPDVAALARGRINRALVLIAMHLSKPLENGARWAKESDLPTAEKMRSDLTGKPARLAAYCREVLDEGFCSEADRETLQEVIDLVWEVSLVKRKNGASSVFCWETENADHASSEKRLIKKLRFDEQECAQIGKVRYRVTLRNVSHRGAMVVGLENIEPETEIALRLGPRHWRSGIIRWAVEDRVGVEFC